MAHILLNYLPNTERTRYTKSNRRSSMRDILTTLIIITGLIAFAIPGHAQNQNTTDQEADWEAVFTLALQDGRAEIKATSGADNTEALAYTLSLEEQRKQEDRILRQAIKEAVDMKAPPCQIMKTAIVDLKHLEFKPYSVIKNIYATGGEIDLNDVCECATEKGVSKQVITQAALDATDDNNKPVYMPDEITQAQCFRQDIGLGFSEEFDPVEAIPPGVQPNTESASFPSAGAASPREVGGAS